MVSQRAHSAESALNFHAEVMYSSAALRSCFDTDSVIFKGNKRHR